MSDSSTQTSQTKDMIELDEHAHTSIKNTLQTLEQSFNTLDYTTKRTDLWGWLGVKKLSDTGQAYVDQLAGYKEYLSKVEKPVLESELKTNPDYFNEILPRAVLFGVETRLLKMLEDLLKNTDRYESDDGTLLNLAAISSMNKTFARSATPPRSS